MIALDTNVLVRLVVEDDVAQVARARAFVQTAVDAARTSSSPTWCSPS